MKELKRFIFILLLFFAIIGILDVFIPIKYEYMKYLDKVKNDKIKYVQDFYYILGYMKYKGDFLGKGTGYDDSAYKYATNSVLKEKTTIKKESIAWYLTEDFTNQYNKKYKENK